MLRLFQRLVLAIVTIVLCASVTSVVRRAAVADATNAGVARVRVAMTRVWPVPVRSPAWHEEHEGASDLQAVESEFDEEDRDVSDVTDDAPQALSRLLTPRKADRVLRGEAAIDTSRFVVGTGLPRGPPAV